MARRRKSKAPENGLTEAPPAPTFGYPRPQLRRDDWTSLDGTWDFAIGEDAFDGKSIIVPFAPETSASGVNDTSMFRTCRYRRTFAAPDLSGDQRLILHFGAVDYHAAVYVNDQLAVRHEGGYTPFSADITDLLTDDDEQTIVVEVEDDPLDLAKPRGKQDWQPSPHAIWYMRTTGIWQSVWMERVNATHIAKLRWTPDVENWSINFHAWIDGPDVEGLKLRVALRFGEQTLADDTYGVEHGEVNRTIRLLDPGIDDARNEMQWSPWRPNLIDAELAVVDAAGATLDRVISYTAMRSVRVLGNRVVLNGSPVTLRLVLDQGYWPVSGLTAPNDDAYRRDVELVKSMGFNGVRKHQKIESPRFLYWADVLGLFVWEEMPSAYQFSATSIERVTNQWMAAIDRDASHPCIIAWVPFNESWGVPDLPTVAAQRHAIQALYYLTKTLDPTRPVIGNDGWESAATDIVGIHDYDADPNAIAKRYATSDETALQRLLADERPGHRVLMLDGFTYGGQPIMLTEFGGIAFAPPRDGNEKAWGYSRARSSEDLAQRYGRLMASVRSLPLLAGFCYTQFTDTYQEANGLLFMDRTPKVDLDQIAIATRGPRTPAEVEIAQRWRQALMRPENLPT